MASGVIGELEDREPDVRHTRPPLIFLTISWVAILLAGTAPPASHAEPLAVAIVHVNDWDRMEDDDGRFPHVAGLSFAFDARRPPGSRITRIDVGGEPLEAGKVYRVATNDFMYTGGDGYTALQAAEVLIDAASGDTMANHLIRHVRAAGAVAPILEGRIVRED